MCTYLNDEAYVLCEMCGEELPQFRHSLASVSPSTAPTSSVQQYDDEPIVIDEDESGEEELIVEDEVADLPNCSPFDRDALFSSSSSSPPSPPRSPNSSQHDGRAARIPPAPRSEASNGELLPSLLSSAFSSLFFSSSASSSTACPPPVPSVLMPLSYIHLPTLPFVSPLSAALMSSRRFATAQRKGETSLLCAQLLIDSRVDTQLLSPLLACLCRLGVQYRVQQLAVAYSVEMYEREVSYDEYKKRHQRMMEAKEDGKAAADDSKPPLDTLTAPLSTRVVPTFFLLLAPRILCRMYGSKQLHAQLKLLEARARELQQASNREPDDDRSSDKEDEEGDDSANSARFQSPFSVHIMVWGLVSLVAQQKQERKDHRTAAAFSTSSAPSPPPPTLPFSSVSSLSSLSSLWLRSGGVCHIEFHHPSPTDAVSALLLHFRHAASARYKRFDEESMFTFGSLRVVKGRTSAMRGANPIPQRNRKRNRQSGDGSDSSDSTTDDSDEDGSPPAPSNDSGSAASVLLSYSESWIHMLCMITGVSEERAAVITRHYPSVRALTDAYQSVRSSTQREFDEWKHGKRGETTEQRKKGQKGQLVVNEGESDQTAVARISSERCGVLLADLLCGQRRLGEEISKRVYRAMAT